MNSTISVSDIDLVSALNRRVDDVIVEFWASPLGRLIEHSRESHALLTATIREVYWEIHCYHPATTKAGFALLGSLSPADKKLMKALLLHKWEEVEHRVWALDGYIALGGDTSRIGQEDSACSPGAFAVAAVWERIASSMHPLSYLGAEYLFEHLTAKLAVVALSSMELRSFPAEGMRFIVDHASEDQRHSAMLQKLLANVERSHPQVVEQILFAFDCFRHVYPMPLWTAAYQRAKCGMCKTTE